MTKHMKMAIVGEVGSGKTQFVQSLSDIPPFSTEVASSVNIGKPLTTVGIDYGRISLGNETSLGLFGLPGQNRYEFLWKMTCSSLFGVVILVRHKEEGNFDHINHILDFYDANCENAPYVIGLTHCDHASKNEKSESVSAIREILYKRKSITPVIPFDPRIKKSALLPIAIFNSINLQSINNPTQ